MPTQTVIKKFNKELEKIKEDMHEIKEYLFSPLKDSEGEYTDSFVKRILSRSIGRGPFSSFKNKESFLKHVRSGK